MERSAHNYPRQPGTRTTSLGNRTHHRHRHTNFGPSWSPTRGLRPRPALAASYGGSVQAALAVLHGPARRGFRNERKGNRVTTETARGGRGRLMWTLRRSRNISKRLPGMCVVVVSGEGMAAAREGGKADAGDGGGIALSSGGLAHCLARGGAKVFWDRRWAWLACLLHRGRGLHSAWKREEKRYREGKKSQRRQETKSAEPRAGFNATPRLARCSEKAETVRQRTR